MSVPGLFHATLLPVISLILVHVAGVVNVYATATADMVSMIGG
jgi:hypothetical protein